MRKIDLVYLWLDGNDKNWRKIKDKWQQKITGKKPLHFDATNAARWRDNDELKYSLRSAEKFAPWINHIYIITGFGQIPKWLDTKNPKITIVPHEKIMPADALPTFNSTAIEMCVMNIPGLSEHFLLANDDTFFGRPLTPDFFFDECGRAIVWFGIQSGKPKSIYDRIVTNSTQKIFDVFGCDYSWFRPAHNIDPYIKSSMIAAKKYFDTDKQIINKFRTGDEIHRTFFNVFDHMNGRAIFRRARGPKTKKHFIYNFIRQREFNLSPVYTDDASRISGFTPPLFCINDTPETSDETRAANLKFMQKMFPEKSRFEK